MKQLRVWYGWSKINKIRKREAISVIFENDESGDDNRKLSFVGKMQNTVMVRYQTEAEAKDAENANRVFTEYSLFMDNKKIAGSLNQALHFNFLSDRLNVPLEVREQIRKKLRDVYITSHSRYKEPVVQLDLFEQ